MSYSKLVFYYVYIAIFLFDGVIISKQNTLKYKHINTDTVFQNIFVVGWTSRLNTGKLSGWISKH